MSYFYEQPDGDIHGECAYEIHRLEAEITDLKQQVAIAQKALANINRKICLLRTWNGQGWTYQGRFSEEIYNLSQAAPKPDGTLTDEGTTPVERTPAAWLTERDDGESELYFDKEDARRAGSFIHPLYK